MNMMHMPSESENSVFASDAAVATEEADRFGRWPFAKQLANVIATRTDSSSLIIAIHGEWGAGKTSVLNFVERTLPSNTVEA